LAGPSMFEARLIERGEVIDASVGIGGDGESGSESTMTRARAYINRGGRTDCAIGGPVEEEDRRVPMSLQALSGGLAVVQQGDARGRARRAAREEERKGDFPHRRTTREGGGVSVGRETSVLFFCFFCVVHEQRD
jgi:hypothetical protein